MTAASIEQLAALAELRDRADGIVNAIQQLSPPGQVFHTRTDPAVRAERILQFLLDRYVPADDAERVTWEIEQETEYVEGLAAVHEQVRAARLGVVNGEVAR